MATAQDVLAFLSATKTSEAMSDDLRELLYVPHHLQADGRPLEVALSDALCTGQSVVVTGSAGGGKTMLVDAVSRELTARGYVIIDLGESRPVDAAVIRVRDLTAITGDRSAALAQACATGSPLLVAANEGVLQETALPDFLDGVLDELSKMQSGRATADDVSRPVVVDMGGIDPIHDALTHLLAHPLLHQAVQLHEEQVHGGADVDLCLRLRALRQLSDAARIDRFAGFVRSALGPGEVLFRDLWDFIADVMLGGDCQSDTDSSAWFWRVFYGESQLSERLRLRVRPEYVSAPEVASALYAGRWEEVNHRLGTGAQFVRPATPPSGTATAGLVVMQWLRAQYALLQLLAGKNVFPSALVSTLMTSVTEHSSVPSVVRAINAYFRRRRPGPADSTTLELWLEMSVSRRTDRPHTLLALGKIPASRLRITRSLVIANLGGCVEGGISHFLTVPSAKCGGLLLDVGLLRALTHGRPVGNRDRSVDDQDFALRRFFVDLVREGALEDVSTVSSLTWDASNGTREIGWNLDADQGRIVRAGN